MPVTLGNQNITSSTGNLGIGTDSPVTLLTLGQSSTGAIAINSNITTSGSVPAWQAASVVGEIRARADLSLSTDGGLLRLSAGGGTNTSTKAGIDMSGFNTTDGGATLRFYTGAERMRIDRAGRVTMPNQPTMHARLAATTTFGANAIFVPTQVNVNIGNHYSSANGLFTAPVAGVYQVAASFLVRGPGTSGTFLSVKPRINGAVDQTYGAIYQSTFGTENNCAGVFQVQLSANDTLGLVLGATGTIELYSQENFMSIRLLG